MDCDLVLKRDNPEITTAQLRNFAPETETVLLLPFHSARVLNNPFTPGLSQTGTFAKHLLFKVIRIPISRHEAPSMAAFIFLSLYLQRAIQAHTYRASSSLIKRHSAEGARLKTLDLKPKTHPKGCILIAPGRPAVTSHAQMPVYAGHAPRAQRDKDPTIPWND